MHRELRWGVWRGGEGEGGSECGLGEYQQGGERVRRMFVGSVLAWGVCWRESMRERKPVGHSWLPGN